MSKDNDDINDLVEMYSQLSPCQRKAILIEAKFIRRKAPKVALCVALGVMVGITVNSLLQPSPVAAWAAFLCGYYSYMGVFLLI